ncbi:hypothetical protein GAS44_13545 [Phocaeicola vulgatus]|nr:hypothetical protein GAS44_13545 [Phocaeicola vulgatus]
MLRKGWPKNATSCHDNAKCCHATAKRYNLGKSHFPLQAEWLARRTACPFARLMAADRTKKRMYNK